MLVTGAGIRPPLFIKSDDELLFTLIIGASPRSHPKSTESPSFIPGTGITRTAVVLLFMTPMAISSAMREARENRASSSRQTMPQTGE